MKKICRIFPVAALLLFALGSCSGNGNDCETIAFPHVQVPGYINNRQEAINYLAENYWDKFFAISAPCRGDSSAVYGVDPDSFDDAFNTYAHMMSVVENGRAVSSLAGLFSNLDSLAMAGDRKPLLRVMRLAEEYFYNPVSPLLNEEIYLGALNGIMALESLDSLEKMQYAYQHSICSLNRVGTFAADFGFRQIVAPDKFVEKTLYKDVHSEYTLLFFNNPDCGSCAQILEAIKNSPLAGLVEKKRLAVLAMYIDEDLSAWKNNRQKYPEEWIYAYDHNLILRDNNIYGLRAIPSMYLLDKQKRVILKDAPVEKVIGYFI